MTRLAICLGDITGIGPEVALKALAEELSADDTSYLIIGDGGCVQRLNQQLRLGLDIRLPNDEREDCRLCLHCPSEPLPANLAPGAAPAAQSALVWLEDG